MIVSKNVLETLPSFDLIVTCTPVIRTGTIRFRHAAIRYTKELITLIAERHNFNKDEAIAEFNFEYVPEKLSARGPLKADSIHTFEDLLSRQIEFVYASEYQKEGILSYSHSITSSLAYKYKFSRKLYENETFT